MIELRIISAGDYDDIKDISKDIWEGDDYLPQVFHDWVQEKGIFLGAVDKEKQKVVATGKLSILHDGTGWLEGLRVHKDYRGRKIACSITEHLFREAELLLQSKKIRKIAFATHISAKESISMMQKLNFKLEEEHVLVSKEYKSLDSEVTREDFNFSLWQPSLDEFMTHPYFSGQGNLLSLAFVNQKPTEDLYKELKTKKAFVTINGYHGIYLLKGEPFFVCLDHCPAGIDVFFDFYLLQNREEKLPPPLTCIHKKETGLINRLKTLNLAVWSDWHPDYLYFVYEEQTSK